MHELQEQFGKMLPDLPEEHLASPAKDSASTAKEVKEEEKVLQLVGDRDSKGRPHGEVNLLNKWFVKFALSSQVEIYYANGDYFWGDCVHGVKEGLASVVLANGDNLMGR